jgi:hypothetical protein
MESSNYVFFGRFSNSPTCDSWVAIDAEIDNECVADTKSTSFLDNYPVRSHFTGSATCTGDKTVKTLPQTCTSTGVDSSTFTYENSQSIVSSASDSGNSSNTLNDGAVAGIVIGVVLGCGVLILIFYYLMVSKKIKSETLLDKGERL